ncbi:EscU/YscU/HrcU family type III secretion system export apparatus switch protein [Trinickia soli]|uniref:Type III secretion protein n=1 Tax=Trinickia soli TaxID=380675 RepID=A0A2N7VNB9_9BURK|nr:EscU/YscU/HrcU family type III secretion system export apparatus switch protein [Trinickia soli]KAA0082917.1 EscU/YscU/HrcU family type III secretion system export apparatus switch protein [Paraburkholderia sp. T12-10]PMS18668.1 type III secretion protein [Trinickia soli]CAB3714487.1 Yop proteins translocation protein U [Trinickia soli]
MSEKDQAPTEKRLRDARKKGQIVYSSEVSAALVFLVVLAAIGSQAPRVFDTLRGLFDAMFAAMAARDPKQSISTVMSLALQGWLTLGIGIVVLAGAAGLAVSLAQVGGLVAFSRIAPSFERLNPASGMTRLFSMKSVVNLLKTGVKTLILCVTLWVLLRGSLSAPLQAGYLRPDAILAVTGKLLLSLAGWAALIFVAFAALDYAYQQYAFLKQHRMSMDEVRREHRESEGDPHMNSRRRSMAHEMVFNSLQDRVKMASAVIHSANAAVALCYAGKGKLPWVAARGEGETARRIVEWAGEFLIPTVADGPLAEALYESAREYKYIERGLYGRVATVLRWADGEDVPT